MKGIILAGGTGTRLYPVTSSINKQLLPIYDKPMIYYPLSTLMLANIRDILIITNPSDQMTYKKILKDGTQWGIKFTYQIQENPGGLAQAFIIAKDFINNKPCVLILGDNIFYGQGLTDLLNKAYKRHAIFNSGATIFSYYVSDPERYGVIYFDENNKARAIEEKPKNKLSNWAVTGLYFYDENVCEIAKDIMPSKRGELEITDINAIYLKEEKLFVEKMGRGFAWLDTGTHESMLNASTYVHMLEKRQGLKICCPEEIAFKMGFIEEEQVLNLAYEIGNNEYGQYIKNLINFDKRKN